MDDVDAVQAQIARNMLESGDWVTARLDGVPYLEKAPLIYWMIAGCYRVAGVHDWVARLPVALSAILLCWLTYRMGAWAFSRRAGMYAGLTLATCVGLFLFTRIQIPDVTITATIALALWAFLRALDKEETRPALWSAVMAAGEGAIERNELRLRLKRATDTMLFKPMPDHRLAVKPVAPPGGQTTFRTPRGRGRR